MSRKIRSQVEANQEEFIESKYTPTTVRKIRSQEMDKERARKEAELLPKVKEYMASLKAINDEISSLSVQRESLCEKYGHAFQIIKELRPSFRNRYLPQSTGSVNVLVECKCCGVRKEKQISRDEYDAKHYQSGFLGNYYEADPMAKEMEDFLNSLEKRLKELNEQSREFSNKLKELNKDNLFSDYITEAESYKNSDSIEKAKAQKKKDETSRILNIILGSRWFDNSYFDNSYLIEFKKVIDKEKQTIVDRLGAIDTELANLKTEYKKLCQRHKHLYKCMGARCIGSTNMHTFGGYICDWEFTYACTCCGKITTSEGRCNHSDAHAKGTAPKMPEEMKKEYDVLEEKRFALLGEQVRLEKKLSIFKAYLKGTALNS